MPDSTKLTVVTEAPQERTWQFRLRSVLMLSIGGLVTLSVITVLLLSLITNLSNTFSLLDTQASNLVTGMERTIRSNTMQAERVVRTLSRLYQQGDFEIEPSASQNSILKAAMGISPIVELLLVFDKMGMRHGILRKNDGQLILLPVSKTTPKEQETIDQTTKKGQKHQPLWGEPIYVNGVLYHNVGMELRKDGKTAGLVVAAIGRRNINRVVVDLGKDFHTTAFVLDSKNNLVAHSEYPGAFRGKQNIPIAEFPDKIMAEYLDAKADDDSEELGDHTQLTSRGRSGYVFIVRPLPGYAAQPYTLGAYFKKTEIGEEVFKAILAAIAGLGALIFALVIAYMMARRLSSPMMQLAEQAEKFSRLDLENFKPFKPSRVKELDDQANAINTMYVALDNFSHYVPRELVVRLLNSGEEAIRPVEREVTIMFSDIVGFSKMSEHLNAAQTAQLLNYHFDTVCGRITANNGTVDKFIGDGIMAFWGAPDADDHKAYNALKAAREIIAALNKENVKRQDLDLDPLRLRIGIHTGRALVGNIGSCDRQNYTIVGNTVNVANRLEELGREYLGDQEAVICISKAVWDQAGRPQDFTPRGFRTLRGKSEAVEVYSFDGSNQNIQTAPARAKN